MQNKIDKIIYSNIPNAKKITNLKLLFQKEKINYFSDFDDTITQNTDLFYSRNKYIKKSRLNRLNNFSINQKFIKLLKQKKIINFVIISRNNHEFIKYFIKTKKQIFQKEGINILAGIGIVDNFKLTSKDKISILSNEATLITDIFEYRKLKNQKNVVFIEKYSILKEIYKTLLKLVYFIKYIILG